MVWGCVVRRKSSVEPVWFPRFRGLRRRFVQAKVTVTSKAFCSRVSYQLTFLVDGARDICQNVRSGADACDDCCKIDHIDLPPLLIELETNSNDLVASVKAKFEDGGLGL